MQNSRVLHEETRMQIHLVIIRVSWWIACREKDHVPRSNGKYDYVRSRSGAGGAKLIGWLQE